MTINYAQVNKVRPATVELTKIQSVRLISTVKEGFEVFLVVVFFEDGKVDTRSFFSQQSAMKKVNELAPNLARFVKVETV